MVLIFRQNPIQLSTSKYNSGQLYGNHFASENKEHARKIKTRCSMTDQVCLVVKILGWRFFPQDGRKREIYKLFIVSKDSLKAQVSRSLGLWYFTVFFSVFISFRFLRSRVSCQSAPSFFFFQSLCIRPVDNYFQKF